MFDSGIKVTDLISQIRDEAEIAYEVTEASFVQWLNSVEQLLYSEIIKEQKAYTFQVNSPLIKNRLNLWPLFNSQTAGDIALTVREDGTYALNTTNNGEDAVIGAVFEKRITLPAGDYTLSDNAGAYYSGPTAATYRTLVKDAANGQIYAGIEVLESGTRRQFTLAANTEVILCINVFPGAPYINGYTFRPQLEAGIDNTEGFILPEKNPVITCGFPKYDDEANIRFEDIHAVYADETQLIKSTLASGVIFSNAYYKEDVSLGIKLSELPVKVKVVYCVRPVPKSAGALTDNDTVKVPVEFIDLVKAKLRGEAYKLSNEDGLAAKWLNDYNVLLETFRIWFSEKQPEFGL